MNEGLDHTFNTDIFALSIFSVLHGHDFQEGITAVNAMLAKSVKLSAQIISFILFF